MTALSKIPRSALIPSYTFTAERFFEFNQWWLVREVVQLCYNDVYQVADLMRGRLEMTCKPMPREAIIEYILSTCGADDWVDIVQADGKRIRNIQRGSYDKNQR